MQHHKRERFSVREKVINPQLCCLLQESHFTARERRICHSPAFKNGNRKGAATGTIGLTSCARRTRQDYKTPHLCILHQWLGISGLLL